MTIAELKLELGTSLKAAESLNQQYAYRTVIFDSWTRAVQLIKVAQRFGWELHQVVATPEDKLNYPLTFIRKTDLIPTVNIEGGNKSAVAVSNVRDGEITNPLLTQNVVPFDRKIFEYEGRNKQSILNIQTGRELNVWMHVKMENAKNVRFGGGSGSTHYEQTGSGSCVVGAVSNLWVQCLRTRTNGTAKYSVQILGIM